MMVTYAYAWIMAAGGAILLVLVLFHQYFLSLERGLVQAMWHEAGALPPPHNSIEIEGTRITVRLSAATALSFQAPGLRADASCAALVTIGPRRLLAVLDRGWRRRTYLVDIERAAEGGRLRDGLVGWWRHGAGHVLTADDALVIEVHRCFGRDRLYWVDPLAAATGHAFGMGIERTIIAPRHGLRQVSLVGHEIHVSDGKRAWLARVG